MSFLIDPPLLYGGGRAYERDARLGAKPFTRRGGRGRLHGHLLGGERWAVPRLALDPAGVENVRRRVRARLDAELGPVPLGMAQAECPHTCDRGCDLRDLSAVALAGYAPRAATCRGAWSGPDRCSGRARAEAMLWAKDRSSAASVISPGRCASLLALAQLKGRLWIARSVHVERGPP